MLEQCYDWWLFRQIYTSYGTNIFSIQYSVSLQKRCLCSYKVPSAERCNNLIHRLKTGETGANAVCRQALAGDGPRARCSPPARGTDPTCEGQREKLPLPQGTQRVRISRRRPFSRPPGLSAWPCCSWCPGELIGKLSRRTDRPNLLWLHQQRCWLRALGRIARVIVRPGCHRLWSKIRGARGAVVKTMWPWCGFGRLEGNVGPVSLSFPPGCAVFDARSRTRISWPVTSGSRWQLATQLRFALADVQAGTNSFYPVCCKKAPLHRAAAALQWNASSELAKRSAGSSAESAWNIFLVSQLLQHPADGAVRWGTYACNTSFQQAHLVSLALIFHCILPVTGVSYRLKQSPEIPKCILFLFFSFPAPPQQKIFLLYQILLPSASNEPAGGQRLCENSSNPFTPPLWLLL